MKPDAYFPFYGHDFFGAVKGRKSEAVVAYLKAIWHYWSHTHCQGLEDDDEALREICEVMDPDKWPAIRDVVFDGEKFFAIGEDGRWHQKRAFEEWQKVTKGYERKVAQTQAARDARYGKKGRRR